MIALKEGERQARLVESRIFAARDRPVRCSFLHGSATREIGIRIVMGAHRDQVLPLMLGGNVEVRLVGFRELIQVAF